MSFDTSAWAIKQKPRLATEKLVLLVLSDCQNACNGACFPSHEFLAEHALCSPRSAMRATQALEAQGYITIRRQKGRSNHYLLNNHQIDDRYPAGKAPQSGDIEDESLVSSTSLPSDTHVTQLVSPTSHEPRSNPEITRRESAPAKKSVVHSKTNLDPDTPLSDENYNAASQYFTSKGKPRLEPLDEWQKFIAYYVSQGEKRENWDAAWQSWYMKSVEFDRPTRSESTRRPLEEDLTDQSWAA